MLKYKTVSISVLKSRKSFQSIFSSHLLSNFSDVKILVVKMFQVVSGQIVPGQVVHGQIVPGQTAMRIAHEI